MPPLLPPPPLLDQDPKLHQATKRGWEKLLAFLFEEEESAMDCLDFELDG